MLLVSIFIVIISGVLYHFCQKTISPDAHPLVSLIITYTTAIVLSLAAFFFFPLKHGIVDSLKQAGWATYLLGIAIFGLEAGYLLAYRAGADLSSTAIYTNAAVAIMLIPIGMFIFREHLSAARMAGIFLCIVGFLLISRK